MRHNANEVFMAGYLLRPENERVQRALEIYYMLGGYQVEGVEEGNAGVVNKQMTYTEVADPSDPVGSVRTVTKTIGERFRELTTAVKSQELNKQKAGLDQVAMEVAKEISGPEEPRQYYGLARWALEYYEFFGEPGLNYDMGRMKKMHTGLLAPSSRGGQGRWEGDGLTSFLGIVDETGRSLTEEESEEAGVLQRGLNVDGVTLAEGLARNGVKGMLEVTRRLGVSKALGAWVEKATILNTLDEVDSMINRKDAKYKAEDAGVLHTEAKKVVRENLRKKQPFTLISKETQDRIESATIVQATRPSRINDVILDPNSTFRQANREGPLGPVIDAVLNIGGLFRSRRGRR